MNTRIAAIGGFIFVVLGWASQALAPQPPSPDASATEWVDWYAGSPGGIQASAFLFGVVVLALLVWFGGIRQLVWAGHDAAPHAPIATVGLSLLVTTWLVGTGISSVVAMRIDEIGTDVVVFGAVLTGVLYSGAQIGLAALMGGVTAQAQTAGTLPRWLVVLGWIGVATSIATASGLATDNRVVMAAVGVSWLAVTVWILGCSVSLWRAAPTADGSEERVGRASPAMSGLG